MADGEIVVYVDRCVMLVKVSLIGLAPLIKVFQSRRIGRGRQLQSAPSAQLQEKY